MIATGGVWQNWMGNLSCRPREIFRPRTVAEVQAIVLRAARENASLRVAGTGHSWSPLVPTDGFLVKTDRLDRKVAVDGETQTVTCGTGIGLQALSVAAARGGLQLSSHPDATEVSIGGIVATGSNGSGITMPPLSDAVVGLTVVRADGEIVEVDEQSPDIHAARLHLGLLGVVTSMKIRCLPAVPLRCADRIVPMEDALADLPALVRRHFAVMVFWYPYTAKAWIKTWDAAPDQRIDFGWPQRLAAEISQYVSRVLLGAPMLAALRIVPWLTPLMMKTALWATRETTYIENVADAFHFEYVNPLLWDACYAVPLDEAASAWRALMQLVADFRVRGLYPMNMVATSRFTKASTSWLSPAFARDTCFLEAITARGTPHVDEFYAAFQDVMMGHFEGRPHWAKVYRDVPRVRGVYDQRLADFEGVRSRWDPAGRFLNPFLRDVLGKGA